MYTLQPTTHIDLVAYICILYNKRVHDVILTNIDWCSNYYQHPQIWRLLEEVPLKRKRVSIYLVFLAVKTPYLMVIIFITGRQVHITATIPYTTLMLL